MDEGAAALRPPGYKAALTAVYALAALAAKSPGPPGVEDWQDDRTVLVFRVATDGVLG